MSKFIKYSSNLLAGIITSVVLLGNNFLYASENDSNSITIDTIEQAYEAQDLMNRSSQLIVGSYLPSKDISLQNGEESLEDYLGTNFDVNLGHRPPCSHHSSHECHEKSIVLEMTLTASILGTIPAGYNIDVTPFAVSPTGKKYVGETLNVSITTTAFVQPLFDVFVPKLVQGTYAVGCDITLGAGSSIPTGALGGTFDLVVLTKHVFGLRKETVNSTFVTLILSDLQTGANVITLAANCQLLHPDPCSDQKRCFERSPNNVTINMNVLYGIVSGTPPTGSYIFTPIAIAPNGKAFRGAPTTLTLAANNFSGIPLNPVTIPQPIFGNYFIGYEISLAGGSPIASPNVSYNFFGKTTANPVGSINESVTFPSQILPLGPLLTPSESFRITSNFVIARP